MAGYGFIYSVRRSSEHADVFPFQDRCPATGRCPCLFHHYRVDGWMPLEPWRHTQGFAAYLAPDTPRMSSSGYHSTLRKPGSVRLCSALHQDSFGSNGGHADSILSVPEDQQERRYKLTEDYDKAYSKKPAINLCESRLFYKDIKVSQSL